ncbi:BAHD acyltransferase DCR isoform X1 [Cryptomeria japonica]|uniref:BAHD acyltransferase DCR isoform X1 n=1 Tax=Cryptomeria japonica TaxID=3369 RepID=UPI0027DA6D7D|nr:BAHD acyltransferase DCR isoform X1 [Cryptomeria japonica]
MDSAMARVEVDGKCSIFPARPSLPQQCKLTYSDLRLLYVHYTQKCVLFSNPRGCIIQDFESMVERLKKSLSETLVHFYPLAGRLETCEGEVYIDCNDSGAEFIEASAPDLCLAQIMAENIPHQLFPFNGAFSIDGHFLPLLAVQVTKLIDGIVLAFTINHALADGSSNWHFINSWSQLCREPSSIPLLPLHTRCFSTASSTKVNIQHNNMRKQRFDNFTPRPLSEKRFHFNEKTISQLKEEANEAFKEKSIYISSFQALCAHVWQGITRARGLSPNEETSLCFSINCRSKMVPPLPYSYFGNALQGVRATMTTRELLGGSRSSIALSLHRTIASHQDAQIKAELDKPPRLIDLNDFIGNNSILMGSSHRFPIYDNDFGWGSPISVSSGWANKFDGKLTVYPGRDKLGSIDIEVCLLPQTMNALESDTHFICPFNV